MPCEPPLVLELERRFKKTKNLQPRLVRNGTWVNHYIGKVKLGVG